MYEERNKNDNARKSKVISRTQEYVNNAKTMLVLNKIKFNY